MKLNEWIDITELGQLIDDGYVSARKHPIHSLLILNYTPAAQSVKTWSDTLSKCRGLVYEEDTLDIYAIPFRKFWNYNDPSHPETLQENLPEGVPAIYEKVDGSLGIGFFYKDTFIIATRGSFESDQAKWAQRWITDRIDYKVVTDLDRIFTYIFEIVIPEDRKVVDYDFSGLVLLGETDFQGRSFHPLDSITFISGIKIVKAYVGKDRNNLEGIQAQDKENEEGYVATWFKGLDTFRVKLKFETYKRLHRMYFQTTTDVIWELLKSGKTEEDIYKSLEEADEYIRMWASCKAEDILAERASLAIDSKRFFRESVAYVNSQYDIEASEKDRRKAFAFIATQKKNPSLLFLLYDAKLEQYEKVLWNLVRPKNERFTKIEE